jgi:replicative DNA helicase
MIDIILVKLLFSKDLFNKFQKIINLDFYRDNNRELFRIFTCLIQLHGKTTSDVSVQDLAVFFYSSYPVLKPEDKVVYDTYFDHIEKVEVQPELAVEYLEKHREQTLATEVAMLALDVTRGKANMGTVIELINNQTPVVEVVQNEGFVSDDLEILIDNIVTNQGLRWRLDTMNKMIGSLRKGDFGFLFARPEMGKTTFLASEISYMAEQANEQGLGPILWFNNEEQGQKVMLRCYQATFGVSQHELFSSLQDFKEAYSQKINGHIKIFDDAAIKKSQVERICAELQPSMIIFDQIDKVYGFDSERYDLKMKAIYQWARELSKKYGPTIGVCQAGGTAENKKYLNMNDVDSSHTAKQGEADFIIGIGGTQNDGEEFIRYLSICKNKLAGDTDTIPELRHGKMSVVIQPDLARYKDSMKWN